MHLNKRLEDRVQIWILGDYSITLVMPKYCFWLLTTFENKYHNTLIENYTGYERLIA